MLILSFVLLFFVLLFKWVIFFICLPLIISLKKGRKIWDRAYFLPRTLSVRAIWFVRRHLEWFIRYIDIQIGFLPSFYLRNLFYKQIFMVKMDKTVTIHFGAEIRCHERLEIANKSIIGDRVLLDARNGIFIGKNVNISSNVSIYTEQHDHRDSLFGNKGGRVEIKDRVWIGPNVIILPTVKIGEGAVIAAGAVVTKDVAPFSIMAGIPAKKIGERNRKINYEFSGEHGCFY